MLAFRTDSSWFRNVVLRKQQMRNFHGCKLRTTRDGWHLSYALGTADIIHKIRSISMDRGSTRSNSDHQQHRDRLLALSPQALNAEVERRVQNCLDPLGRPNTDGLRYAKEPYDGVLPPLPGWPRHLLAPY